MRYFFLFILVPQAVFAQLAVRDSQLFFVQQKEEAIQASVESTKDAVNTQGNAIVVKLGDVSTNQRDTTQAVQQNGTTLQSIHGTLGGALTGSNNHSASITSTLNNYRQALGALPATHLNGMVISDLDEALESLYSLVPTAHAEQSESRQAYQASAKQAALEHAEWTLSNAQKRMREIETLASTADQAETIKESQDVSNRLLLEIMHGLQEINTSLALQNRARESKGAFGKTGGASLEEPETAGLNKNTFATFTPAGCDRVLRGGAGCE